jgi:hypothetical protein
MATNINQELFKRYAPKKKIEIINNLNEKELLSTTPDPINRIVREVGNRRYKSRDKELRISSNLRTGNGWNSWIESVGTQKNKLYLDIYIQMDHTDATVVEEYNTFFKRGDYQGKAFETNRYGDKEPHYCHYTDSEKARVIQSILLQYVHTKYKIDRR